MKTIITRIATIEDLPILKQFEQGIIHAERPYDTTLAPDPISYYDLEKLVESENAEVVIAVCKNEIIGSGFINIVIPKPYLTFSLKKIP